MPFQFSLRRLFLVVVAVAMVLGLFASLHLQLAILILIVANGISSAGLHFLKRTSAARVATFTCVLFMMTLIFTDWGYSSQHHLITISWPCLVPACISQLALILTFLWTHERSDGPA